MVYKDMNFGYGVTDVSLTYSDHPSYSGENIEFRKGGVDGFVIVSFNMQVTGG